MKRLKFCAALVCAAMLSAASARAAYIVGGHTSEKGHATFSFGGDTTTAGASVPSTAVGLTGTNSIFGGDGVNAGDTYVFSYTPGVNADNTTFNAGDVLGSTSGFAGEGHLATGLAGGASGMYNVYFTAPETTNISSGGSNFHITSDGPTIDLMTVNLNNGGTGPDTNPGTGFVGGANNSWHLLGTVKLTAGNTYSVSMDAIANTFVSQRAHAVMWERAVPEPASLGLAALAICGLAAARRR